MNNNNNSNPTLQIPYFEFLRLSTWIKLSGPNRLIGTGHISLLQQKIIVNRFNLLKQKSANSLSEFITTVEWDLVTAPNTSNIPLWFLYDPYMIIPVGLDILLSLIGNIYSSNQQIVGIIIDTQYTMLCLVSTFFPAQMHQQLKPYIIMPVADQSAISHWITEFTNCIPPNQEQYPTLADLAHPSYYAFQHLPDALFFKEQIISNH